MTKIAIITLHIEHCKGCGLCVNFCPQNILFLSSKINNLGYQYVVVEKEEKCTGCGMCFTMCPDVAIQVERIS